MYFIGFIISGVINHFLKLTFKEQRPERSTENYSLHIWRENLCFFLYKYICFQLVIEWVITKFTVCPVVMLNVFSILWPIYLYLLFLSMSIFLSINNPHLKTQITNAWHTIHSFYTSLYFCFNPISYCYSRCL